MTPAESKFQEERNQIQQKKRTILAKIREANSTYYEMKRQFNDATSDLVYIQSETSWNKLPKVLWATCVRFSCSKRLKKQQDYLSELQDALQFCHQEDSNQFMKECKFLGATL